jgi:hypothetical protein
MFGQAEVPTQFALSERADLNKHTPLYNGKVYSDNIITL